MTLNGDSELAAEVESFEPGEKNEAIRLALHSKATATLIARKSGLNGYWTYLHAESAVWPGCESNLFKYIASSRVPTVGKRLVEAIGFVNGVFGNPELTARRVDQQESRWGG